MGRQPGACMSVVQFKQRHLETIRMARHRYLIKYSNGIKRHVSRQELDTLSSLEQIGPREYLSKSSLQTSIEETTGPCYLPGTFIFELKGKKHMESMESVRGLVRRLKQTVQEQIA